MIETVQTFLDQRPRLRLAQRVATDSLLSILAFVGRTAQAALVGVAILGVPLAVFAEVITSDRGGVSAGIALQIFALAGACSVVANFVLMARQYSTDRNFDRRPPHEAARSVVAQAIVARGLGEHYAVERLCLGLDQGGWLEARSSWLVQEGQSRHDLTRRRLMDELTVALAGISPSTAWHSDQERVALNRVAEIVVLDALSQPEGPVHPVPTASDALGTAAERIQSLLAAVSHDKREQIADELLRARSMRGQRLEVLLTERDLASEPEADSAVASTG